MEIEWWAMPLRNYEMTTRLEIEFLSAAAEPLVRYATPSFRLEPILLKVIGDRE